MSQVDDILEQAKSMIPETFTAILARELLRLRGVIASKDAEAEGMVDDAYRLGVPLRNFYEIITEHMRTEGGIPMTDALGACIDAIEGAAST